VKMIRIILTPPGEAPVEIREKWIGCQFSAYEPDEVMVDSCVIGVCIYTPVQNPEPYYEISIQEVLKVLKNHNQEVYTWWEHNLHPMMDNLCFPVSCAEVIGEA